MTFTSHRILAAAAVAATLLSGCSAPPPPADDHIGPDLDRATALAAERGVPVLVDFYSPT